MRVCAGGAAGRAATAPPSRLAGILRHRWSKKNPALASGVAPVRSAAPSAELFGEALP